MVKKTSDKKIETIIKNLKPIILKKDDKKVEKETKNKSSEKDKDEKQSSSEGIFQSTSFQEPTSQNFNVDSLDFSKAIITSSKTLEDTTSNVITSSDTLTSANNSYAMASSTYINSAKYDSSLAKQDSGSFERTKEREHFLGLGSNMGLSQSSSSRIPSPTWHNPTVNRQQETHHNNPAEFEKEQERYFLDKQEKEKLIFQHRSRKRASF